MIQQILQSVLFTAPTATHFHNSTKLDYFILLLYFLGLHLIATNVRMATGTASVLRNTG